MSITYQQSGVNIDAGNESVRRIKELVKKTFDRNVLSGIGGFGSMYDIHEFTKGYKHPILVQSTDSVGTKVMIASAMDKYDTIGRDIVAHSCDDVLAMGARPITFLDYIAANKIIPGKIEKIVSGIADACAESGVSLVGGETAELGGVYAQGEFDLVGAVAGIVEKDKIITGAKIQPQDAALGLPSSGLHTNGYSLARKLFFEIGGYKVSSKIDELHTTVGEALLTSHINYTNAIFEILDSGLEIKGLAHITGGGFIENIPRMLPAHCAIEINKGSWPILPVFEVMREIGSLEEREMFRTFNMGIGMVVIVAPGDVDSIINSCKTNVYKIGQVIKKTTSESVLIL